jgi:cellulose synthase/poly-beta-1,6-N-acetylglucosamine synthase-like glycosyltransferase
MAAFLFLAAAAFVLYTLAGYPLLLHFLARRRSRPIQRAFQPRTVSVLLPVFNGERFLAAKLDSLLALDYPPGLIDIYVLSDGSTDSTAAIAEGFAGRGVHFQQLPHGGKAAALNAGLTVATGEILFLTDVRQPLEPNALRVLVACFADPAVGAVSGELIIRDGATSEEANVGLYWKYEKWLRKRLSALDSVLGATGCIYAMRRDLARPLPPGCLLDDMFLPLQAFFAGYRVVFEGQARAYDYPTSLDSEFRRKVRTLAGNYQLIGYMPQLLGPANRLWLHFFSHKVARLLLPFSLLVLLGTAPFLPPPWYIVCTASQLAFYLIALADPLLPDSFPGKKLSSPARTFAVLMAASFCAASILFRPKANFWVQTRTGS